MNIKSNNQSAVNMQSLNGADCQPQFTKTLARISNILISMPPKEADRAITEALRLCGELFDSERSYIFQFSDLGHEMSNTHEWCLEGINPQLRKMQNLPVTDFSWTTNLVKQKGHLYISDVEDMPPEAGKEKQFFLDHNISSLILIALTFEGKVKGFFGFDLPVKKRNWKDEQINILKVITDIIAGAIAKADTAEELLGREEMFRSISENSFDLIALLDLNGNCLYCNQSYYKILGYDPLTMVGNSFFDIIHPADKGKMISLYMEGIKSRLEERDLSMRLLCKDGSFRWTDLQIKLLLTEKGEPDKVLLIAQDISERKHAEEQTLIQRNLGLKLAAISDLSQAFRYCLSAAIDASGMDSGGVYMVDQADGSLILKWHQGLSADFHSAFKYFAADSPNAMVVREGNPHYISGVSGFINSDTAQREGLTAAAVLPVFIDDKPFAAINVASHTLNRITPGTKAALEAIVYQFSTAIVRIKAEQSLQESAERYHTLVSNIPGIIFRCAQDLHWTMYEISGDVEDLTGYKASDFIDSRVRSYNSIIYADDREYVYNAVLDNQFKNQPFHIIYRIIAADGGIKWVRQSCRIILGKKGSSAYLDGIITDISELKKYEERLRHLKLHDHLTGLYNREFLEVELARLEGSREYPVSIITIQLEGLSLINQMKGHLLGDQTLKSFSELLKKSLRSSDILARVGGDDFTAVLPSTDSKTSKNIAGRIRENMALYNEKQQEINISIAMGVATSARCSQSLNNLYKQANNQIYRQ